MGQDRPRRVVPADLLVHLAGHACGQLLTRLPRSARRGPRPVALPGGTAMMRPVQKEVSPPFRGAAGNHGRGSMRTIAADRLTVPGGELPWTTEVSHGLILAPGQLQVSPRGPGSGWDKGGIDPDSGGRGAWIAMVSG